MGGVMRRVMRRGGGAPPLRVPLGLGAQQEDCEETSKPRGAHLTLCVDLNGPDLEGDLVELSWCEDHRRPRSFTHTSDEQLHDGVQVECR